MKKMILLWWLTIPHILAYLFSGNKDYHNVDIERWTTCRGRGRHGQSEKHNGGNTLKLVLGLIWLLLNVPEYRNVFYLRFNYLKYLMMYLKPYSTLYICTPSKEFGPGVFIQHGFATVITAEHVGRNCWINQQVTIGYNDSKKYGYGKPWIGDNVRVSAGAKVVGKVKIGDGSTIGVNAVVVKDVAPNSTVVPSPMMLIRENGEKVYKQL